MGSFNRCLMVYVLLLIRLLYVAHINCFIYILFRLLLIVSFHRVRFLESLARDMRNIFWRISQTFLSAFFKKAFLGDNHTDTTIA